MYIYKYMGKNLPYNFLKLLIIFQWLQKGDLKKKLFHNYIFILENCDYNFPK